MCFAGAPQFSFFFFVFHLHFHPLLFGRLIFFFIFALHHLIESAYTEQERELCLIYRVQSKKLIAVQCAVASLFKIYIINRKRFFFVILISLLALIQLMSHVLMLVRQKKSEKSSDPHDNHHIIYFFSNMNHSYLNQLRFNFEHLFDWIFYPLNSVRCRCEMIRRFLFRSKSTDLIKSN